jgi:hypothetical protein
MPFSGDIYSLSEIKNSSQHLIQTIEQHSTPIETHQLIELPKLTNELMHFFEIAERVEMEPALLDTDKADFSNISELGDYGLQLMAGLELWTEAAKIEDKSELQVSILSLAVWVHNHKGVLKQLENIVNALSQTANNSNREESLIKLHEIAEKITNATHDMIKKDLDKSEPGRPWRILNLNHGIIATRTHNTDIMNSVYEQLMARFPEDAATFFAEGMKQMELIDYPEHVKDVVQQFYLLTNKPTLH